MSVGLPTIDPKAQVLVNTRVKLRSSRSGHLTFMDEPTLVHAKAKLRVPRDTLLLGEL